jgi:rubrerythrin
MGTPRDIRHKKRFLSITNEIEGVDHVCKECNTPLKESDIDCEGIGAVASALPMMYCPICGAYYICWRKENE